MDEIDDKAIIKQLVDGDTAKAQNKLFRKSDSIAKIRLKECKLSNAGLLKASGLQTKESTELKKSILEKDNVIATKTTWNNYLAGFSIAAILFEILKLVL